ncbi:hypothetical protein RDWZM_009354 [Blomia tropicalis]|uniref:Claspin n=1 Tax=Blomia tropicalis TaxID=40697 RepID=A0A9Q0M3F7_BLOTA|nr:hypothetical protein RDWZM_009354 [Blomia tropicalis]
MQQTEPSSEDIVNSQLNSKMSSIKSLLATVRMNPPPLILPTNEKVGKPIVLVEGKSLVDKLCRHRKNDINQNKKTKDDPYKWLKMKEKMTIDLESKRDEEWKKQTIVDKLEDEEFNEMEEENEDLNEFYGGDDEIVDSIESIEKSQDELNKDDNEEIIADDLLENEAIFDENQEEIENQSIDENNSSDDESFASNKLIKKRCKIIDDDDENEENDTENVNIIKNPNDYDICPCPIPELDSQDYFVSQNFPLSPGFSESQKRKNVLYIKNDFNINPEFDSQMEDLCSGQFNEDLSGKTTYNKNFEVEDESIVVDLESDDKLEAENEFDHNESDDNECNDSEEDNNEEDDGDSVPAKSRKNNKFLNQFIEDEAELSGSEGDVSSDENDSDEDDELEHDEVEEDLPSDDELRGQVEKIYNKELLDEDKRQMMILKEMYFDDGDLHDEGDERKKKFKWQISSENDDNFDNPLSDSESENSSDSEASDDDGNDHDKTIRLKKNVTTTIEEVLEDDELDVYKLSTDIPIPPLNPNQNETKRSQPIKPKVNGKISSFFYRDERLQKILTKRPAVDDNLNNKRQKTNESKSIFDTFKRPKRA